MRQNGIGYSKDRVILSLCLFPTCVLSYFWSACRSLQRHLDERGLAGSADAILVDLGVSSMQLDQARRGFSFMQDGPLDMRMNASAGLSAEDIVNGWSEQELGRIIRDYGEDKMWRTIARRIVDARYARSFLLVRSLVIRVSFRSVRRGTEIF
jgi:16S rRNA (cytosine(1402)-N(4))-methyltransferase